MVAGVGCGSSVTMVMVEAVGLAEEYELRNLEAVEKLR